MNKNTRRVKKANAKDAKYQPRKSRFPKVARSADDIMRRLG